MTISEKSAYLKGLMDGLKLSTETDEGKMISAIVDLLGDMAKRITDIEETTIAISDELDEIEEDGCHRGLHPGRGRLRGPGR